MFGIISYIIYNINLMNNLFLIFGGIFTTSLIFLSKKTNFYYNFFLKGNDIFYRIKNYKIHNFKINTIHEAEYDNEDFLVKGKKIYERRFYSDFINRLNTKELKNKNYIVDYFTHGKD